MYPTKPVGAAVIFDKTDRAIAVFTLGTPFGYTQAAVVYGFSLTVPGRSVCL